MKEQIDICKNCAYMKRDLRLGIICSLTNQKTTPEKSCNLFKQSESYLKQQQMDLELAEANKPIITIIRTWKCDNCNEINEYSSGICWKCKKWRDEDDEIIEEKFIGKSKNEEKFERKLEKGSGKRYLMEGTLIVFFTFGMGILLNSFLGLRIFIPGGNTASNMPELVFLYLILYNIFYAINYFSYIKDIRIELGFSLLKKGVVVNVILIGFYLLGKILT